MAKFTFSRIQYVTKTRHKLTWLASGFGSPVDLRPYGGSAAGTALRWRCGKCVTAASCLGEEH